MGIVLKGLEIENFKSYVEKQFIQFSDLSVLLGANSSGKSTALQALLTIKQTMECNSPDEDLLLSGKYVALGDYDDAVSASKLDSFAFAAIFDQTEKSENMLNEDRFKIGWSFKQGKDGTSAVLDKIDIKFENMQLSFRSTKEEIYHLYINEKRSSFSAEIHNLLMTKYFIHYDTELNHRAAELLNELSRMLISQKTTTAAADDPIGIDAVKKFYFRLLDKNSDSEAGENAVTAEMRELAIRLERVVDDFCDLEIPEYENIAQIFPKDFRTRILELAFINEKSLGHVEELTRKHEEYLEKYKASIPDISEVQGSYDLGINPFLAIGRGERKEDNLTQLKYALDFYKEFCTGIISKIFFVGPIREMPKGLYNVGFEAIPKYVGSTGSYFASVLLHENKKEGEYILPNGKERCTLSEALAAWMIHLNIASSVNVDKNNSFGFSVSVENLEQVRSDIMNVGIGTSQILPVLISVLLSEPNEILIFEQPELHLHPYSQSRLADMFVEFCKRGRKIVLETHSEYFLLRLRYHIVKEDLPEKAAAINFFHNSGGTIVEAAHISGLGSIEYPEGFRDETQILIDEILDAALERKGL